MMINLASVAENILETLSKDEVDALIVVLQYYNACDENVRADCFRNGCRMPRDAALEQACKASVCGLRKFSSSKSAGEMYLSTQRPVCPCCRQ